ncbi:MAG: tRNA (adenosine(37)-N6)-threonylcarbamoyltransferase complex ATPase subunit type 1 TsaE [Pseudomonadota bacterium]
MPLEFKLDEIGLERFAADIAIVSEIGDCFTLYGDLGAGKTTFSRAFIRAVAGDFEGALEVPSPTFTLVQTYALERQIAHFDFYRLADELEAEDLGLSEYLEDAICLIEWPENAGRLLPENAISIRISAADDSLTRNISISGPNASEQKIARSLKIRQLLSKSGWPGATREAMSADASTRRYEIASNGDQKRFVMDAPRQPDGLPVRDGKPYSQLVHLAEDVSAFIAVANALRSNGFTAPEIFAHDLDHGLVILDDLGMGTIVKVGAPLQDRYEASAQLLAHIHSKAWSSVIEVDAAHHHKISRYDFDVFKTEASLFLDWYVPRQMGRRPTIGEREQFERILGELYEKLDAARFTLLLRDYHSPNIIWRDENTLREQVGLIDFQDALMGPPAYDLMSLAEDARVDGSEDLRASVLAAYAAEANSLGIEIDADQFSAECAIVSAQRAAKILGIFVRLDERDGKPDYLKNLPRVEAALKRAVAHPMLLDLKNWLTSLKVFDQ